MGSLGPREEVAYQMGLEETQDKGNCICVRGCFCSHGGQVYTFPDGEEKDLDIYLWRRGGNLLVVPFQVGMAVGYSPFQAGSPLQMEE